MVVVQDGSLGFDWQGVCGGGGGPQLTVHVGGDVLKGEKGVKLTKIIFDKDDPKVIVGYKKFVVFNSEQCKNLDSDLKLNQEELEIYKTLRGDGSDLTRKALAKTSKNLAV